MHRCIFIIAACTLHLIAAQDQNFPPIEGLLPPGIQVNDSCDGPNPNVNCQPDECYCETANRCVDDARTQSVCKEYSGAQPRIFAETRTSYCYGGIIGPSIIDDWAARCEAAGADGGQCCPAGLQSADAPCVNRHLSPPPEKYPDSCP